MATEPTASDFASLCLAITEHAPLPIATVEGDTHIVRYANPAFCRLMSRPSEELVGKPMCELLPNKDECVNLLSRVFRSGKPESHIEKEEREAHPIFWSYTSWPVLADERLVGVMIQVTETTEAHGKAVAMNEALMLGSIRQHELTEAAEKVNAQLQSEIAARKITAQELAEKARLIDLSNDAIIVRGLDDTIRLWNKGAEKLFGWSFEEVKGKDLHTFLQTEFPKPKEEILEQLRREGRYNGEVVQVARDGRRVRSLCGWVLDQETHSIFTSYTDITARTEAAEALRESEERYRNLFNSIDEGFCVIEMIFDDHGKAVDYRFLEVNPSFEKQSGLHNVVGKRMRELAPGHEDYWFETYGNVALTGEPIRYVKESNAWGNRWFDVYAFRLGGSQSGKVAVLFTDITERKRNELALEQAQSQLSRHAQDLESKVTERTAKLRESVGSLEILTYTMAHDLRAPLRAMKSFTTALMEDVPLDETGKDYATRIHKAAGRMDQLVNDLLDYGQLTHLEFPLRTIDLKTVINNVLARHSNEIQTAQAEVQVAEPIPSVVGNELLLEQILFNLLSNAFKFVGPGVLPKIHIHAEPRGSMVRLWMEDNGIGIAPEYLRNVFGMFTRLHTTDEFAGTGVGLAIVKRAVERMGGAVGLESEPGRGSRFWVELPIAQPEV